MAAEGWVDVDATPTAFQAAADVQTVKAEQLGLQRELKALQEQQADLVRTVSSSSTAASTAASADLKAELRAEFRAELGGVQQELKELRLHKAQQDRLEHKQSLVSKDCSQQQTTLQALQQHTGQAQTAQATLAKQVGGCEKQQAMLQDALADCRAKQDKVQKKLGAMQDQVKQLSQKIDERFQALQDGEALREARIDELARRGAARPSWAWCLVFLLAAVFLRHDQQWRAHCAAVEQALATLPSQGALAAQAAAQEEVRALAAAVAALERGPAGAFERVGGTLHLKDDLEISGNLLVHSEEPGKGNVVIGKDHDISEASSALVAGYQNAARGAYVSVLGLENVAVGRCASVAGGQGNLAKGEASSVAGGLKNTAEGAQAAIAGGWLNLAKGDGSAVAGGKKQVAHRRWSLGDSLDEDDSYDATGMWSSIWPGTDDIKDKKKDKKEKDKKKDKKRKGW